MRKRWDLEYRENLCLKYMKHLNSSIKMKKDKVFIDKVVIIRK